MPLTKSQQAETMAEKPTEAQWEEAVNLLEDWQRMFPKPMKVYVGARDESEWLPKAEAISKRRDALLAAVKPDPVPALDAFFMNADLGGAQSGKPYSAWFHERVDAARYAWQIHRQSLSADPADEQSVLNIQEGLLRHLQSWMTPEAYSGVAPSIEHFFKYKYRPKASS